jgi:hypothetical protein
MRTGVLDIALLTTIVAAFCAVTIAIGLDASVWLAFTPGSFVAIRLTLKSDLVPHWKAIVLVAVSSMFGAVSAGVLYVGCFAAVDLQWTVTNGRMILILSCVVALIGCVEGAITGGLVTAVYLREQSLRSNTRQ